MTRCGEAEYECPCPPVGLIDVVGKKWAVCVVTLLGKNGSLRFGPIQRCLPKVSPATLTATLRSLEQERLVRRAIVRTAGEEFPGYGLTSRGETLYQSLLPLASWLRET